ncbi:hypothetical protein J6590_065022 [Homalodisca vitripennis]|nr:hypothetical protein J6590_065022 [Homalodisca vitripennis]
MSRSTNHVRASDEISARTKYKIAPYICVMPPHREDNTGGLCLFCGATRATAAGNETLRDVGPSLIISPNYNLEERQEQSELNLERAAAGVDVCAVQVLLGSLRRLHAVERPANLFVVLVFENFWFQSSQRPIINSPTDCPCLSSRVGEHPLSEPKHTSITLTYSTCKWFDLLLRTNYEPMTANKAEPSCTYFHSETSVTVVNHSFTNTLQSHSLPHLDIQSGGCGGRNNKQATRVRPVDSPPSRTSDVRQTTAIKDVAIQQVQVHTTKDQPIPVNDVAFVAHLYAFMHSSDNMYQTDKKCHPTLPRLLHYT